MKERYFVFDTSLCIGCLGCIAACINENRLQGHQPWRRVFKLPPHDGDHDTLTISLSCNHCQEPACVTACPANALMKRPQDGIVVHEPDLCLGCRYCQMACPYDAIVWLEDKEMVGKCHMCWHRLERGEDPACVATCFSKALQMITKEELDSRSDLVRETTGFQHHPDVKPRIRFIKKENPKDHGRDQNG